MVTLASFFAKLGLVGAVLVSGWLLLNIAAIFGIGQALSHSKWKTKLFLVSVFPLAALLVLLYTMVAIILSLLVNKTINREGSWKYG